MNKTQNVISKPGSEWFEKLTKLQQKQYKANTTKHRFDLVMSSYFSSFHSFMELSFIWKDTPESEGFEYWSKIAYSKKNN